MNNADIFFASPMLFAHFYSNMLINFCWLTEPRQTQSGVRYGGWRL